MSQKEEEAGLRKHEYFTTVIYYCQLMLASQQWCKAFQVLFYQIYWEIWYQFSSRKQQWKLRYRLGVQLFHLKILWGFSSYTNVFIYIYISSKILCFPWALQNTAEHLKFSMNLAPHQGNSIPPLTNGDRKPFLIYTKSHSKLEFCDYWKQKDSMLKQELLSKPSRIRNRLLQPLENPVLTVPCVAVRCSSRHCFSWAGTWNRTMERPDLD